MGNGALGMGHWEWGMGNGEWGQKSSSSPSSPSSSMRSLKDMRSLHKNFAQIRGRLEQQGVYIPSSARGAYRDLDCKRGSLRLYAIAWPLSETAENPEWMLLIALGTQPQAQMPTTLTLEIRDQTQQLFERSLSDTSNSILYAQVIGNWGEQFWITVTADNAVFEIPPFGFSL